MTNLLGLKIWFCKNKLCFFELCLKSVFRSWSESRRFIWSRRSPDCSFHSPEQSVMGIITSVLGTRQVRSFPGACCCAGHVWLTTPAPSRDGPLWRGSHRTSEPWEQPKQWHAGPVPLLGTAPWCQGLSTLTLQRGFPQVCVWKTAQEFTSNWKSAKIFLAEWTDFRRDGHLGRIFKQIVSTWALVSYCREEARFAQVSPAATSCPTIDPFQFSFYELVMVRRQGTSSPPKIYEFTFPTFKRFSWGL